MAKALITGIMGQDGSYLAEYLLARDYEVHGIIRPATEIDDEPSGKQIMALGDRLRVHHADLTEYDALVEVIQSVQPDECYHLAAETFVASVPEEESALLKNNTHSTHHLLMALHREVPECRMFFAGSSEMFGQVDEAPQNEDTPFNPRSIYGVSKVVGHDLLRYYREHQGLFACTGVLYNHESPRRGIRFVTRKITSTAVKIKLGLEKEIRLGNIEAQRDWGFAGDYVRAMHGMLTADQPEDYVIATGTLHSVRDFLELTFGELDLNYEDHLVIDQEFYRPNEEVPLVGDCEKIHSRLQWAPQTSFEEIVRSMVQADLEYFQSILQ